MLAHGDRSTVVKCNQSSVATVANIASVLHVLKMNAFVQIRTKSNIRGRCWIVNPKLAVCIVARLATMTVNGTVSEGHTIPAIAKLAIARRKNILEGMCEKTSELQCTEKLVEDQPDRISAL